MNLGVGSDDIVEFIQFITQVGVTEDLPEEGPVGNGVEQVVDVRQVLGRDVGLNLPHQLLFCLFCQFLYILIISLN